MKTINEVLENKNLNLIRFTIMRIQGKWEIFDNGVLIKTDGFENHLKAFDKIKEIRKRIREKGEL